MKALNFTKISQTDMREETKKAVFCVSERVISQSVVLRRDRQGYHGGIPDIPHDGMHSPERSEQPGAQSAFYVGNDRKVVPVPVA